MPPASDNPILAIDCATSIASVALRVGGVTYEESIAHGQHAAQLVPVMDVLLRTHGVAYADIAAMITTLGPGSFTGLRLALATVHGLALAHGTPVKATTSLACMAWEVAARTDAPTAFYVALHMGKGEACVQAFTQAHAVPAQAGDMTLIAVADVANLAPCYGNVQPAQPCSPHAATLCRIATHLPITPLADILPIYIRPPDATPGTRPAWLA